MKTKLPDKPSQLILLALQDLEEVEKLKKKFKIDMSIWLELEPYGEGYKYCSVCFAGAVMAQSLDGIEKAKTVEEADGLGPFDYPYDIERKLVALNEFRIGSVESGLDEMRAKSDGIDWGDFQDALESNLYKQNPRAFKEAMASMAGILAAEGL